MPANPSTLATVCSAVGAFVRTGIGAATQGVDVTIGAPAATAAAAGGGEGGGPRNRLNLFFYRFEPFDFQAARRPEETWRLRMYCLITAYGVDEDEGGGAVSAGENELRLLGQVLRVFGEQPVLDAGEVSGERVQLQTILLSMADEQLNQVWSTQGEATYRPSVLYEMGLTPIVPTGSRVAPPLVGEIGQETRADPSRRFAAFAGLRRGPLVPRRQVDTTDPRWAPACCWLQDGRCVESLSFDLAKTAFASIAPQLWLAGDPATAVELIWQVWSSTGGWQAPEEPQPAQPFGPVIDPDAVPAPVPGTFPLTPAHPLAAPAVGESTQALLYARREVTPIPREPALALRSNPLLLTIHRSS